MPQICLLPSSARVTDSPTAWCLRFDKIQKEKIVNGEPVYYAVDPVPGKDKIGVAPAAFDPYVPFKLAANSAADVKREVDDKLQKAGTSAK